MDFHMPDSYYDPPEYTGCEDCECEDCEWPEAIVTDDDETKCECKCHDISYPSED